MLRAAAFYKLVEGRGFAFALQKLLKLGFRVFFHDRRGGFALRVEETRYHAARGFVAAVAEDRAEHSLDAVGGHRVGRAFYTFAEAYERLQAVVRGPVVEAVFADEARAQPRELAFAEARICGEEARRGDELEHGVAEELKPFVVGRVVFVGV